MTQDADHDPEFEAFLKRRSPIHRRLSEIDSVEPPSEIDRLVLNRAREAISAPSREPIYRSPRWAMPVGLAATILIAFTVVLNIDHRNALAPNAPVASSASPEAAAAPVAESAPAAAREHARALASQSLSADGSDVSASVAQAPPPAARASAPALAKAAAAEIAERSSVEEERVLEEPVQMAAQSAAEAAEAEMGAQRRASIMSLRAARSAASGYAPAPQPAPARSPATQASSPATAESSAAETAPPSPTASNSSAATAASSPAAGSSADIRSNPEAWLQEINRLRAAGQDDEADRELAAFREAYPSHPGYSVAKPPSR